MCYKKLYQTVDDRGNPDEVEECGPFKCTNVKRKPWLGEGYYFWEKYIENAHWWGLEGYQNRYMICSAICKDCDIFDLTSGNLEHLDILREYWQILSVGMNGKTLSVSFILMHMRKHSGDFNYAAIRADGINTVNNYSELLKNRLYFPNNKSYINLIPQIQICIIDKKRIKLKNYKIIHPIEYCSETVV